MQENLTPIEKLPAVLTLARVADIAQVTRRTVRRWVKAGLLKPTRVDPRGSSPLYFDTREVLRVLGVEINSET